MKIQPTDKASGRRIKDAEDAESAEKNIEFIMNILKRLILKEIKRINTLILHIRWLKIGLKTQKNRTGTSAKITYYKEYLEDSEVSIKGQYQK